MFTAGGSQGPPVFLDVAPAIEALGGRADALHVCIDPVVNTNGVLINSLALALAARLPTMHSSRDNIDAGGMISYGPDIIDLFRRAAEFVDNILRGAKPADLPVEQPIKFELVMNLRLSANRQTRRGQTRCRTADGSPPGLHGRRLAQDPVQSPRRDPSRGRYRCASRRRTSTLLSFSKNSAVS